MIAQGITVENVAGPAGAVAAHMLLTHGLGIGSLVLVIYLVFIGLALIGAKKNLHFWSLTLKCLVSAIGLSLITGLVDLYLNLESVFPYGGYHGRYINLWLIARIQWIGAVGISLVLTAILTYMYINDIVKLLNRITAAYRKARPALSQAVDKEAERLNDNLEGEPAVENDSDDNNDNNDNNDQMTGDHSAYMPHNENDETEMMPVSVSFDDDAITSENAIDIPASDYNEEETDEETEEKSEIPADNTGHDDNIIAGDTAPTPVDAETETASTPPEKRAETISAAPDFDINVTRI